MGSRMGSNRKDEVLEIVKLNPIGQVSLNYNYSNTTTNKLNSFSKPTSYQYSSSPKREKLNASDIFKNINNITNKVTNNISTYNKEIEPKDNFKEKYYQVLKDNVNLQEHLKKEIIKEKYNKNENEEINEKLVKELEEKYFQAVNENEKLKENLSQEAQQNKEFSKKVQSVDKEIKENDKLSEKLSKLIDKYEGLYQDYSQSESIRKEQASLIRTLHMEIEVLKDRTNFLIREKGSDNESLNQSNPKNINNYNNIQDDYNNNLPTNNLKENRPKKKKTKSKGSKAKSKSKPKITKSKVKSKSKSKDKLIKPTLTKYLMKNRMIFQDFDNNNI